MKKFIVFFVLLMSLSSLFGCAKSIDNNSVVRIHIRANSNATADQEVKMIVKDKIVDYITPIIAKCNNSDEVKNILEENLSNIENVANMTLVENSFSYKATAELKNEYFPSRSYNGEIFPADYYDAVIVRLGSGIGDNWWCVAYPPLCFVGEDYGQENIQYKSKLYELINKYFGG